MELKELNQHEHFLVDNNNNNNNNLYLSFDKNIFTMIFIMIIRVMAARNNLEGLKVPDTLYMEVLSYWLSNVSKSTTFYNDAHDALKRGRGVG